MEGERAAPESGRVPGNVRTFPTRPASGDLRFDLPLGRLAKKTAPERRYLT